MNAKSTDRYSVDSAGNQVFDFFDARKSIPHETQRCGHPECGARFPIVDYKKHLLVCPAVVNASMRNGS